MCKCVCVCMKLMKDVESDQLQSTIRRQIYRPNRRQSRKYNQEVPVGRMSGIVYVIVYCMAGYLASRRKAEQLLQMKLT